MKDNSKNTTSSDENQNKNIRMLSKFNSMEADKKLSKVNSIEYNFEQNYEYNVNNISNRKRPSMVKKSTFSSTFEIA